MHYSDCGDFLVLISDCKEKLMDFVREGQKNKILPLPVSFNVLTLLFKSDYLLKLV